MRRVQRDHGEGGGVGGIFLFALGFGFGVCVNVGRRGRGVGGSDSFWEVRVEGLQGWGAEVAGCC